MDRRAFLGTLAGALLATPLAAEAQPAAGKVYRIGVLYPGADNSIFRNNFNGFRQALGPAGYVEGRNLALDVRVGDGRALAPLAAELAKRHPDLIVAVARPGVLAMHTLGPTLPVVALDLESDPVASRFVKTLPRPGGNITGVFMDFPELAGKWFEILKTTVQRLARVAVLWDPSTGPAQLEAARQAAQSLKLAVYPIEARSSAEIEPAFRAAMRQRPNGMVVLTSPIFNSGRREIGELAARHRLPTLVPFPRLRAGRRFGFVRPRCDNHVRSGRGDCAQDPRGYAGGGDSCRTADALHLVVQRQDREGPRADDPPVAPAAGG